jgi:hypothetical protein
MFVWFTTIQSYMLSWLKTIQTFMFVWLTTMQTFMFLWLTTRQSFMFLWLQQYSYSCYCGLSVSVELRLYPNLRGVKTTKSASVRRVLLSSATNTTQHTKSETEQTTEHKMRQRGNNSYIIYRKLTDHASYLVEFQHK